MTSFLYPFLDENAITDRTALLTDLARSAEDKWRESGELATSTIVANQFVLHHAVGVLRSSSQILVAGNGGSACDAERLGRLLRSAGYRVRSLVADPVTITALANDVGVELIFARQVEAYARAGDSLIVFSTSGASANLLIACTAARRLGIRTVALAGYDGGPMADHNSVEFCLRVASASVHRIQEAQAVLIDHLVAAMSNDAPT